MALLRILALIGGFAVLGGTASSVLRTLVVPRAVLSKVSEVVLDSTVRVSRLVADRIADYERRDNILAWAAPLSLMTLLFTWIASFWIGFSLLDFGFTHFTFSAAMRQAGSSIATLGFAASPSGSLTILDIAASITGMVIVALQIAYLPTLYAAYNRRESLITVLSARGGEPAWGPEILARHVWLDLEGNLPDLYSSWESWAATVSESHTSYGPDPLQVTATAPLVADRAVGCHGRRRLADRARADNRACRSPTAAPDGIPDVARPRSDRVHPDPPRRVARRSDPAAVCGVRGSRRHAELDRTEDRAHCRAGVAAFSGLAGELRGRRLRTREAHRCGACPVVGSPAPTRAADPAGPTGQQEAGNNGFSGCRSVSGPRAGRRRSVSR